MSKPARVVWAPSILSADFARLGDAVQRVLLAGAEWIHFDVMDGHFVPNLSFGPALIAALRPLASEAVFDAHLMVEEPDRYLDAFARAGVDRLTVHAEACRHLHRTVQAIRDLEMRPGVALNPGTPIEVLDYLWEEIELVVVMSVNPGFAGQRFIPSALDKLARLRELKEDGRYSWLIEVDGGITRSTAPDAVRAGAEVVVAASAIFGSGDPAENLRALQAAVAGAAVGGDVPGGAPAEPAGAEPADVAAPGEGE